MANEVKVKGEGGAKTQTMPSAHSRLLKRESRDQELINNFLHRSDIPQWFRGTSNFQMKAADNLYTDIRDDAEQSTSHRTRASMIAIGLEPIISPTETMFLMRLSRGNDIAFLWFLLELHYKTPGNQYTVNEQLIMSTIAHLDMVTTLRELDALMPPPQPTKQQIQRKEQRRLHKLKEKRMEAARERTATKRKGKPVFPYFEPLARPKKHGKLLYLEVPDFKPSFESYEIYSNPNYVTNNERSRWYASYVLQPENRIVKHILRDEVSNLFNSFAEVKLNTNTVQSLCEYHQTLKAMEEKMQDELTVIARDRCLAYFDTEKDKTTERTERIRKQLEQDVETVMCKFRKLTMNERKQYTMLMLTNEADCRCHLVDVDSDDTVCPAICEPKVPVCSCADGRKRFVPFSSTLKQKPTKPAEPEKPKSTPLRTSNYGAKNVNAVTRGSILKGYSAKKSCVDGTGDCAGQEAERQQRGTHAGMGDENSYAQQKPRVSFPIIPNIPAKTSRPSNASNPPKPAIKDGGLRNRSVEERKSGSGLSEFTQKYGECFEYDPETLPTPSNTFFKAAEENKPYLFDYRKIFKMKDNNPDALNLKKAFIDALDSDIAALNELKGKPTDVGAAVDRCAKTMWRENVAIRKAENEAKAQNVAEKTSKELLFPEMDYYDPDDQELMNSMLKSALNYLAKDSRFVLAAMPDVWKLPLLREWTYARYGKTYTKAQRYKSFSLSLKIFRALDKMALKIKMPTASQLGSSVFVDYKCRDYLIKKSNAIKEEYYNRLDAAIMNQARVFWFAMRPYLCSNGPPRNTYFAFMPSRPRDIQRFRLWKPTEFMDAKKAWEHRILQKQIAV